MHPRVEVAHQLGRQGQLVAVEPPGVHGRNQTGRGRLRRGRPPVPLVPRREPKPRDVAALLGRLEAEDLPAQGEPFGDGLHVVGAVVGAVADLELAVPIGAL